MAGFTHLTSCSWFSFLRGTFSPEKLVGEAMRLGMDSVALTDYRGLYGAVPFYQAAKAAGVKPIFGAFFEGSAPGTAIIVLAKDAGGYSNMCRLITADQLARPKRGAPNPFQDEEVAEAEEESALSSLAKSALVSEFGGAKNFRAASGASFGVQGNLMDLVTEYHEGLIVLCSDPRSLRELHGRIPAEDLFVEYYREDNKESRQLVRELDALSDELGIRRAASNRVHFLGRTDFDIHHLVCAIRTRKTVETLAKTDFYPEQCYLKSPQEMAQAFEDCPDALRATAEIAERCNVELPVGKLRMPSFEPETGQAPEQYLRDLCERSLVKLYPPEKHPAAKARLDYELEIIFSKHFAEYFLIVWDMVRYARSLGIPSTGRGSAADSLVSYLLDLTHVDPIEHNLYFERFLSHERTSPPDIDIDLCWRRRDFVVEYVYKRWGSDRVAMIATVNTFAGRSCVREVGKALGLSDSEMSQYTAFLPHFGAADFEKILKERPESRHLDLNAEPLRSIIPLARRIEGMPSHLGLHASGIVVAPEPLMQWVPLEMATKGLVVTQYDMYPIEDLGYLKIDLLGQRSLSVIADVGDQVRREKDPEFGWGKVGKVNPEKDTATQDRIASGHTMGVFQIESPGIRGILRRAKARDFETVTVVSSVIRPGPKDSGALRSWIRRHVGLEKTTYLHPLLEEVLSETHGIMVYQEDVLKVVQVVAGMSLGRADMVRRSMSDKRPTERLATMEQEFIQGAVANGLIMEAAAEIWRQMRAFAGYAFCKAHSASYTVLSFQAAYLKEHYPAEFMAAVLANGGGVL